METLLQALSLGIAIGGTYALMGVGLNLIFGVMRIANFAHGALYMIGGYAAFYAFTGTGLPIAVAMLLAIAVGGASGYLVNAVFLRQLYKTRVERPIDFAFIVTFALSMFLGSAAIATVGSGYKRLPGLWNENVHLFSSVQMSGNRIVAFVGALALIGLLLWVVKRTDIGRGWRALTQSLTGAEVVGLDVFRLANLAFATSGMLAAAAGSLLVPIYLAYPGMGSWVLSKSLIIVVIGGLGSIGGGLVGGFALALAEVFGAVYIDPNFTEVYGFAAMLLILLLRPQGLFGSRMDRAV